MSRQLAETLFVIAFFGPPVAVILSLTYGLIVRWARSSARKMVAPGAAPAPGRELTGRT